MINAIINPSMQEYPTTERGVKKTTEGVQPCTPEEGVAKRALERQKLEIEWCAEYRNKERKAEDYRSADTENIIADIETGVIEATGIWNQLQVEDRCRRR